MVAQDGASGFCERLWMRCNLAYVEGDVREPELLIDPEWGALGLIPTCAREGGPLRDTVFARLWLLLYLHRCGGEERLYEHIARELGLRVPTR